VLHSGLHAGSGGVDAQDEGWVQPTGSSAPGADAGSPDAGGATHPPSGVVGSSLLMVFAPMVNVAGNAVGGPAPTSGMDYGVGL
jgi:hypothetical protein